MPAGRAKPTPSSSSPIARILANTAWLLGGKGFGALCSIVYLAILTRTLGLKGFGHFSLIFGTAQALIAIAGFQTWRVVVRYGASHVHERNWAAFGRLGMFAGVLDAVGAACGCLIAAVVFFGFAHLLDLNEDYIVPGFLFCCAQLWALVSAPTGMVRAMNKFQMAVYVEAVVPVGRLLGAVAVWLMTPSVGWFLFVWALVDLIEAALYWAMARKLCPEAVRLAHLKDYRRALDENPGLWHFFLVTFAGSTLDALTKNGPLLIVGGIVGTRAAGLYRLASQLSQALSKFSTMLTRAVYAEVSRMRVASSLQEFRKLAVQTSLIAGAGGLVVVGIALVVGRGLLGLIGGTAFEGGAAILVPLAVAASFDLASVAFEPVLHSTGKAQLSLTARLIGLAVLGIAMVLLIHNGPSGAAWAVAMGSAALYVVMGGMAFFTLRHIKGDEPLQPAEQSTL
ncbi:O-antigen/teichoic acid export membrane protein [Novosphingobium chloroacetimidivorans]|uniref:O-antigen/teichoic acid export membrane protein n=1 Tax=Novosphingobium chloroacetimidivorans TaxID=1428314 RepID=A0A7W7K804_9SPHN|nr:lipopolysaccharide biosynthesis protein [Novosphingobium chloroacetimidivorans]MBB4857922.1 O-antigen/teichoic acid export membrane protein [Novosphingobium chloroacetimidivorans]